MSDSNFTDKPQSLPAVGSSALVRRAVALSIRQPWAWLIAKGYKDIENRNWPTHFRGRVLIHASKGMTDGEYADAFDFAHAINPQIMPPDLRSLARGGIVGEAEIVDCVTHSSSPWFVGQYGFVLRNAKALLFQPCKGALGFFQVSTPNAKVSDGSQPPMTFDLSLSESAGSRSLDRLVRHFVLRLGAKTTPSSVPRRGELPRITGESMP